MLNGLESRLAEPMIKDSLDENLVNELNSTKKFIKTDLSQFKKRSLYSDDSSDERVGDASDCEWILVFCINWGIRAAHTYCAAIPAFIYMSQSILEQESYNFL